MSTGEVWKLNERIFEENQMYSFIEEIAKVNHFEQTTLALPLMKKLHFGQVRKGQEQIPYINHPLMMACHAVSMGLVEDDILAAILLHDVCEDCSIVPEELSVNDHVRELVRDLTYKADSGFTKEENLNRYYQQIRKSREASVIKAIDRCNNVSTMASGFTKEKTIQYIKETEKYVLPVLCMIYESYPESRNVAFLLRYHMVSILESLKRTL